MSPVTTTKRAYTCGTCDKTFRSQKELDAHVKKAHGGKFGMMKTV